jgi:hypothetical protein
VVLKATTDQPSDIQIFDQSNLSTPVGDCGAGQTVCQTNVANSNARITYVAMDAGTSVSSQAVTITWVVPPTTAQLYNNGNFVGSDTYIDVNAGVTPPFPLTGSTDQSVEGFGGYIVIVDHDHGDAIVCKTTSGTWCQGNANDPNPTPGASADSDYQAIVYDSSGNALQYSYQLYVHWTDIPLQ